MTEVALAQELTLMEEAYLNTRIFTKEELLDITREVAVAHDVSYETMVAVVECESRYNQNAFNASENSRGLVQIHELSHPDITDEQAYNPHFALNFLGENLAEGRGYLWTCWRNLK